MHLNFIRLVRRFSIVAGIVAILYLLYLIHNLDLLPG